MLLWSMILLALLLLFLSRIAASPPFPIISGLFTSWADRCHNGPDLRS
jgi:hypothetical protein